jgi:hypothetical protein
MAYIHIFKGNVSAGALDGMMCSEGTNENPITTVELDATMAQENQPIILALRIDSGYKTNGDVTLQAVGDSKGKWAFAPVSNGAAGDFLAYDAPFVISDELKYANYLFAIKARASADEQPQADYSVHISIKAKIVIEL